VALIRFLLKLFSRNGALREMKWNVLSGV